MSNMIQRKSRHHGSSLKKDENNVSTLLKTKRNGLKYPRYSKTESTKWKTNNLQLARENARLRNDVQKCIAAVTESAIRYENLEVAWRRRGETLSKIDIISRLVGNQISKLVDTLTELRTACQVELSIPLHEALTEPLDQISYLRHSMPVRSDKSTQQMNSRSQLVNHVNPMVSGHPIIKPTITLQRLNLRNVPSNVPGEQIQVQSRLLNEVEIPLERLSLAQIAERIGSPVSRNSMSRLESQDDRSIFASPEMSSHIPMDSILEESPETFSPRNNSSARESPRHLVHSPNSHWPEVSFDERSSIPNRHSNNSTRKYSATSRVKTPTSAEQRNRINADVEKCCLVVALKDVGSYLHNGTLTNVELLEERKVKTGASAHSDVKLGSSNENDDPHFNISSASGEDQIEVNFTAEIQTMDYGDISLHNNNEKENSFSATQEFFNRIRNEDPLEGPSWRYENVTTRDVKKRQRPQCLNFSPSAKKNKQDVFSSINKPKKNNILDSSKLLEPTDKHLKLESENLFNNGDIDTTEMEFAKCSIVPCEANTSIKEEEEKKFNISDVSIEHEDCLESSPGISSCVTNNEVNLSLNKIEYNSELEINCKSNRPKSKSYKNIGQNRTNSCKQRNTQKEKCVSKSHSKEEKEKKKSGKRSVKINKKDIKTVPETLVEQIVQTRRGSMYEEQYRARRRVAPKCLKEPMLNSKLRRE